MKNHKLRLLLVYLFSCIMILVGLWLAVQALQNIPDDVPAPALSPASLPTETLTPTLLVPDLQDTAVVTAASTDDHAESTASTPIADESTRHGVAVTSDQEIDPVRLTVSSELPTSFNRYLPTTAVSQTHFVTTATDSTIRFDLDAHDGDPVHTIYFAAASRFDTIDTGLESATLSQIWQGRSEEITDVVVLTDTIPALVHLLGPAGDSVVGVDGVESLVGAAWSDRVTLAFLPFELLDPRLVVHAIDGQNPVENDATFVVEEYPLSTVVYAHGVNLDPKQIEVYADLRRQIGPSNRDASRLTVLAMTGVTAMVRHTAAKMDQYGAGWPAEVIGPELATADITHISNEVPFVPGCETNEAEDNLTFCSKPEYLKALQDTGVDIVGLTGNHQNDFGVEGALASLDFYKAEDLPVYGGGRDKAAAFAPLLYEHNGNRFAFSGRQQLWSRLCLGHRRSTRQRAL